MHPLLKKLLGLNWLLFGLMMALCIFGVFAIYSATWMRTDRYLVESWSKQTTWIVLGLVAYFVLALVDYRWLKWGALPLYVISILGLVAVKIFGVTRYGARSWLDLGVLNFQPSQMALMASIMVLALALSQFQKLHPMLRIMITGAVVGAPWLMILKEPDLGSCIVWVPVVLAMFFIGGIPKRYLITMILIGAALIPLAITFVLKPYQVDRLTTFLHPERDPKGTGWTINQSLIAIGSGGFEGKGFKAPNTQNELGFLPETIVHNDFIFSVIGEQHGFLGGALLMAAFGAFIITGLYMTSKATDIFGVLLATGIMTLIFTHTFMNVGMTISVTPITGLPLPFISYGGSFVLLLMSGLGIMQSIWIHRDQSEKRREAH
ncbi:MAG TPA: rod shape-determining protein RodA [Chthoniobacterales bacterium]|jgi:rod shape determining protein RodA